MAAIVRYPATSPNSGYLESIAKVIHVAYECLHRDGFLSCWEGGEIQLDVLAKLYLLWVMGVFLLRFDLYNNPIEEFWAEEGIGSDDPLDRLIYVTETYQELFHVGPIIQMALMSYYQVVSGRKNRGLLLDSMHCAYMPYVHSLLTADEDFLVLAQQNDYFRRKVLHVDAIGLRETPYLE